MQTRKTMLTLIALLLALLLLIPGEARAGPLSGTKTATAPVDLNTASAERLMRLPGIGRKRAEKIIARRTKKPFRSTQELASMKGIGPKLYKRLQPFVRITTTR